MKRSHWPLMIVGCLIPAALLAIVFRTVDEVSSLFLLGFMLLCPAVHLLLMRDHPTFGRPGSDEATIDHD